MDELGQSVFEAIEQLTTYVGPEVDVPGDALTELSIAGPWQRSRGASSLGVNGT